MKESWRYIRGYEGIYQVSTFGNVKQKGYVKYDSRGRERVRPERILNPYTGKNGYKTITLSKNGKRQYKLVHRLVADAFIPNPFNKPQVNHIDENKINNNVFNLQWATSLENINHGTRAKRQSETQINGKQSKTVIQKSLNGDIIKIWPSAAECGRNGFNRGHVSSCCNGVLKKHKGYLWEYA